MTARTVAILATGLYLALTILSAFTIAALIARYA